MKPLNDNLKHEVSITTGRMVSLVAVFLAAPVALTTLGVMGLLKVFGSSFDMTTSLVVIGIGTAAILLLFPFTFSLRHVCRRGDRIVAKSPFFPTRIYSAAEIYALNVSISSPPIATLKFVDGSKVRYIPTSSGTLFDVGEPTKRLIELAETNRKTSVE